MKSVKLFVIVFLCSFQLTTIAQAVESGVSETLAKFRKQHVSNISYSLHFSIANHSKEMSAEEKIYFGYAAPHESLLIDFKSLPNSIKKLRVNGKSVKVDHRNEHLIIPSRNLRRQKNEVEISFISSGKPVKIDTNGLAYTFFVPAKAREAFPCFDQPDLKASFSLKLTVPRGWTAVSNGVLTDSVNTESKTTFNFAPTLPISTYLFAFAAGKFSKYSETRKGRTINFYYRETDRVKIDSSLLKCMDLNFRALDFLSEYLGMPYPFPKFDFVEIPQFSVSGMEHPGAVFYNGRTLFMDVASATEEFARANTIGHEVSHMWFGDDVTMRWFNDVWLKEVFANYMGNRFASSISPQKDLRKKAVLSNFPATFSVDRYPSSEPINRSLPNLNQAGLVYGSITYNKAPIAIHQLALLMGEEAFRSGLQDYVSTFKGGNADLSELMLVFQKHTTADLKQFSKAWIDQPGRPVINFRMDTAEGKITGLTFTQQGEWNKEMTWPQRFEILLAYSDGVYKKLPVNLNAATQNVPEATGVKVPDYIIFNSSGEGYGIFPFDERALKNFEKINIPEARASTVINLFERMLRREILPERLLEIFLLWSATEPDRQILERELKYVESIYWRYLNAARRKELNATVEQSLHNALKIQDAANRTAVFRTFIRIAESDLAVMAMYQYWDRRVLPPGVVFGSNDWNQLARELAVRGYRAKEVLQRQRDSITDEGTRRSFSYVMSALSPDVAVRDSLFNAILQPAGRPNDNDVATAVSWLHHPLRQLESIRYIPRALAALPEILQTSDIFFPTQWIGNMLENYASAEALKLVKNYLSQAPSDLRPLLLQKVKQAADGIGLASEIAK